MPSTRVAFAEIESWTPAIDGRAVENGSLFVLGGKNYFFDVKGPMSGFGSLILPGGIIDDGLHPIQSLDLGDRTILCTHDGIYDRRWSMIDEDSIEPAEQYWFKIGSLDPDVESNIGRFKWTSAYVGFGAYICHPSHGIYQVLGDSIVKFHPDGLIDTPLAIAEANGRLIIQGRFQTQWSNAFDPDDLAPELGGSGFQTTAELVPGTPLTIVSFEGGFVVYTSGGILLFEYVGGDIVFRPDRVQSQQTLVNPNSTCETADGENVILTRQGLYLSSASKGMSELSPKFNAFLLKYLEDRVDLTIRLDYILERDHLYVQVMDGTAVFVHTWILTLRLDKWGEFNESHRGIVKFENDRNSYGWVDYDGYAHEFIDSPYVETADGTLRGLESFIELGYIRPSSGAENADVAFEIQEVSIAARKTQTSDVIVVEEDWTTPGSFNSYNIGFYRFDQDWNGFGVDAYDINFNDSAPGEDWNLMETQDDDDWNQTVAGQRDYDWNDFGYADVDWNATPPDGVDTSYIEDWGRIGDMPDAVEEDWNWEQAFFNQVNYDLKIRGNFDGHTEMKTVYPKLAMAHPERDLWTGFSYGYEHVIVLEANQPWEKFHVTALGITVHLAGQYS